jgi:uncharacterized protein (TIGR02147 family)
MIFECADYRTFLKRTLSERVLKNPSYSMRSLARQLEMAPSMLSSVLNGKRNLSVTNAYKIASQLELADGESEYLALLVQLESADTLERKAAIQTKLRSLNPDHGIHDLTVDRFRMISNWYHLPILEMSEMRGVEVNASSVSALLKISKTDAELALDRLERLELLERDDQGLYRKVHDNLLATSELPDEGLRAYYRQMFSKAIDSVDTQTPQEKLIGSFNVAFDPAQLEEAKALLKDFFMKIGKLASKGRNRRKLYHLSSVFFDLTPGSGSGSTSVNESLNGSLNKRKTR